MIIRRPVHPRDLNSVLLNRAAKLHRLMAVHINHDPRFKNIADFQTKANAAVGIYNGDRRNAKPLQIKRLVVWMQTQVDGHERYCRQKLPKYFDGVDDE